MTALDEEIQINREIYQHLKAMAEETRRALSEQEHEAAIAGARLQGLERAAELVRGSNAKSNSSTPVPIAKTPVQRIRSGPAPKGRQFGAISKVWRGILNEMTVFYPDGATDEQVAEIGRAGDLPNLRPKDARRQMQKYRELGFIDYAHPLLRSGWKVTPDAASRFGIELPESKAAADSQSAAAPEISSAERVEG